ncbi:dnaJ protein homolog 1-like [Rhodamnia argentea]|uniref:DnaJ protein homolog 1-like n=1 Tax=Rhodamnia argentea TaxID=178133 RepID=A0ABM3HEW7_9MYRT|nr:dnaJ protein homolog 1-like [Rhodamnia argentea]
MADPRSPTTTDLSTLLGLNNKSSTSVFHISKACKFLHLKWHHDKSPSKKTEAEADKILDARKIDERVASSDDATTSGGSLLPNRSVDDSFFFRRSLLSKSLSRRSKTPTPSLSRMGSRINTTSSSSDFSTLLRSMSKKAGSEAEAPAILSRNMSRKGSTPIVFSHTAARRKPAPIDKKLECTLEELFLGSVKKVKIKRDVISDTGIIQEEETLKINVKPGWKKGTKISFEGKGDERPGYLPADIVFSIEEKRHPLFKRRGDDLEIAVEIPLVQALTGCTLSVPLLGGEDMRVPLEEIIFPGYEKAILGQGMPNPKEKGKRGDLRLKFFVEFPDNLDDEQRSEICSILEDCCYT